MIRYVNISVQRKKLWNENNPSSELFLKQIELCGRICYKTENKITRNSAYSFVKGIAVKEHFSVTEFGNIDYTIDKKINIKTCWTRSFRLEEGKTLISTSLRDLYYSFLHSKHSSFKEEYEKLFNCFFKKVKSKEDLLDQLLEKIDREKERFKAVKLDSIQTTAPEPISPERYLFWVRSNRVFSHEIVRHRLFSFLQESQRYCRYKGMLQIIDPREVSSLSNNDFETMDKAFKESAEAYNKLLEITSPQIARQVLPNATKTEMYILGYKDYWNNWVLKQRNSKRADPVMQKTVLKLLREFGD